MGSGPGPGPFLYLQHLHHSQVLSPPRSFTIIDNKTNQLACNVPTLIIERARGNRSFASVDPTYLPNPPGNSSTRPSNNNLSTTRRVDDPLKPPGLCALIRERSPGFPCCLNLSAAWFNDQKVVGLRRGYRQQCPYPIRHSTPLQAWTPQACKKEELHFRQVRRDKALRYPGSEENREGNWPCSTLPQWSVSVSASRPSAARSRQEAAFAGTRTGR